MGSFFINDLAFTIITLSYLFFTYICHNESFINPVL